MVNIKDVAERAGVSIATVSYVLNNTRTVRPETAERVRAAVAELAYSINLSARSLAIRRSHILGLIISDITNPFFPEIIRAFQDQALVQGMETIVMYTNYDEQRTLACAQRLIALRVPGVAVLTTEIDPSIIRLLEQKEISAVYLDHGRVDRLTSNVRIDYSSGLGEALAHLKGLGHQRIAYIGGPVTLRSARARKQAFLEHLGAAAASAAEVAAGAAEVIDSDFTVQGGYAACAQLMAQPGHGITALVTANDLMAIGAMHWAYDHGVRIPDDLSLVGFDNISFTRFTQPALTTIDQPAGQIGRQSALALEAMIDDARHAGQECLIQTHLVERQSTAAPRRA